VSIASEYDHAEHVVADVALLQDMAEGRLDDERVRQAAQVLLEHRREELPSVSVAVAARLLGVSRTTVESWREAGVLTSVPVRRRRYEVSIESIVRVQALLEELRRLRR
jgi:DNA-binding transcriptional regulator YiaG